MTYVFSHASPDITLAGLPHSETRGSQAITPPRGFSQFIASFFGCWRQGIHRALFVA